MTSSSPFDWGFDSTWQAAFDAAAPTSSSCVPGRVIGDGRDVWHVAAAEAEWLGRVSGKLRYESGTLPVAGDWVAIETRAGEGTGTIRAILPRRTRLARRAAGRSMKEQVVAANVDVVFVVSALDRELNARRLERWLALVYDGGARPVLVLNKADRLGEGLADPLEAESVALGAPVHSVSALTGEGLDGLASYLAPGKTVALVGSSGVGKSTLVNRLLGAELLPTAPVREDDDRGRHTTTGRRIIPLPGRALLLDTPGLREVGLSSGGDGLGHAFDDVAEFAALCRFRDCRHDTEPGCEVRAAVTDGRLEAERFESFRKLEREAAYEIRKTDPLARAEEMKRWKAIFREARRRQDDR